jgi:hypothetical protein
VRSEIYTSFWQGNPKERYCLKDRYRCKDDTKTDLKVLRIIKKKQAGKLWARSICLSAQTNVADSCGHVNVSLDSITFK